MSLTDTPSFYRALETVPHPDGKPSRTSRLRGAVMRRLDQQPAFVLLIELFIGIGWLRAATEKIIDVAWWRGDVIERFVAASAQQGLPWYHGIAAEVVAANLLLVTVAVVVCQLAIGVALIGGRRVVPTLALGIALSLNFLAAGEVNPAIFYSVCQLALLLWLLEHRVRPRWSRRVLHGLRIVAMLGVVASLPFIATLHPDHVIEDPAAVLALFSALLIAASTAGLRSIVVENDAHTMEAAPV